METEKIKLIAILPMAKNADEEETVQKALQMDERGADAILFEEEPGDDASHEKAIAVLRQITAQVDIPVIAGGFIRRLEDVKKYLYAGARQVFFDDEEAAAQDVYPEAEKRFGEKRLLMRDYGGSIGMWMTASDAEEGAQFVRKLEATGILFEAKVEVPDFYAIKQDYVSRSIPVDTFVPFLTFEELKKGPDGLVPVIVQDYKTSEVLMMAYMNAEAYRLTCETGKMTYYSRSRQSIWVKGETSGHFQYVRKLLIDCDNDTILAKVRQVGAACHTGNRSCFYRELAAKDYSEVNPLTALQQVYDVIHDRKENPREGSYTNYLFDKGIDKILKKVGEEASEIIIAAKNPDPEEVVYEISDFLYHMMVLMAEKGLTWEDITRELANREN